MSAYDPKGSALLDHLVRPEENAFRNVEPNLFRGLQVDHHFLFVYAFYGQLRGALTGEDLLDILCGKVSRILEIRTVRDKSALLDRNQFVKHSRQFLCPSHVDDGLNLAIDHGVRNSNKCVRLAGIECLQSLLELID